MILPTVGTSVACALNLGCLLVAIEMHALPRFLPDDDEPLNFGRRTVNREADPDRG